MAHTKLMSVSSSGEISFIHKSITIPTYNINVKKRIKYDNIKSDKLFSKELEINHKQRIQMMEISRQLHKEWNIKKKKIRREFWKNYMNLMADFIMRKYNESVQRELNKELEEKKTNVSR